MLEDFLAKKVESLDDIPAQTRLDEDVVHAAKGRGLLHSEKSVLEFIDDLHGVNFDEEQVDAFYSSLPEHLQEEKNIALAIIHQLKCSYWKGEEILDKIPSLRHSKLVVVEIMGKNRDCFDGKPDELVAKCPPQFLDDKDFMLDALRSNEDNIHLASERLLSDADFVQSAISIDAAIIGSTSPEFHL